MATKAYTLQLIYYQIQQETVYYVAEAYTVEKEQHQRNIVTICTLDMIVKS